MMEGNQMGRPANIMPFMDAVQSGMSNWSMSGRASRSEYWWLWLAGMLVQLVCITLATLIHWIFLLPMLALFPIFLTISVRRLHDVGQSGWMLLIGMIPIVNLIGGLVLLYWFAFCEGDAQENSFGPVPTNMLE
tara:strand:- start:439 stop:840 length:402 start_codon:yes stop_codon:yes gene_type:complete